MATSSLLRPEVGAPPGLFSRAIPGPSSAPRRGPVAVARLGTLGTRGCRGVSLRAAPLVRGRVAVGFTAPRAIASDKIPKRADDAKGEPSEALQEKIPDPEDAPKPPSAVIDVRSMTSTASNDDPEAASDGGSGGGGGGDEDGGSGGGGGGGDEGSGDAGGRRPGQPELPESMVALATWAVSQTKDWSAAADGGLRAAFGTLVGVNCITVMLVRAMRGRSERRRRARNEAEKAALEARNVAAHEEELAALSRRRDAEKNAATKEPAAASVEGGLAAEKEVGGAGTPTPAFHPARRDPDPREVLNSMGRTEPAAAKTPETVPPGSSSSSSSSFGVEGLDTDEAEDFLVRALESYDGVDALEGLPDAAPAVLAEKGVQSRTSPPSPAPSPSSPPLAGEDLLAFAVIPDDARDPRVVQALGDAARAQAAAADAMRNAAEASAIAADATAAAQRLQRAIAAGASEEELNAISAQARSAANGAVAVAGNNVAFPEGATPAGNNVGRAAKAAAGGIAAAAGAVARGVSIATPVVVDGARRYVPAAADAVGRGAKTVWDGDEVEGKRRPGLKQRAGRFFAKFKRRGADGGEDGGETAAPAV